MGIQGIEAKKRNCFFYDELQLKMHDNYTQANCKLECAIKYAQNMTGFKCTPWYLPTQDSPGLGFPARHIIFPNYYIDFSFYFEFSRGRIPRFIQLYNERII